MTEKEMEEEMQIEQREEAEQEPQKESDSSSSDDGAEEETLNEIASTEQKLLQSPYDYKSHTDLINLLRKVGELEKLREARTNMTKLFPLTQTLWLEWIEDEKKFAESKDDHDRIEQLFEKAVKDYMCPEVWLEYSQYSIRWLDSANGLKKIRGVMERAVAAVGLHVTEGAGLWEMYREFENAQLLCMQPRPGSVASAAQQEQIKKQTDKISGLFKAQLAVPLFDMENTFDEFIDWCESDVDASTKHAYEQTLKQLEELKHFEDSLAQAALPKLEEYQNYINHEIKHGSSARAQCLYERAIVDNCLNSELWIQYLKYMSYQSNPPELLAELHLRSIRNCPWVGQLWVLYLLALERCNTGKDKLDEVFSDSMNAGFSTAFEYVELWKTKCSQIRRRISSTEGRGAEERKELCACFETATNYIIEKLIPAFSESGDPNYTMWTFWARCEVDLNGNLDKARDILQNLTQTDAGARRKLGIYRQMYEIERLYGGEDKLEKCRSVLRNAVQNCAILPDNVAGGIPDAEVACELLLDFERQHGNLKDMDESLRRVTNKLARIAQRKEKEAATYAAHQGQKKSQRWQPKEQSKKQFPRKRKAVDERQDDSKKGSSPKQQKLQESSLDSAPADVGFKAPAGLPVRYVKKAKVEQPRPAEDDASKSTPPGFKDNADLSKPSGFKGPPPGFKGPPPGFKGPPPGFKGPPPGFKAPSTDPKASDENNNKDDEQSESGKTAVVQPTEQEVDRKTIFVSNLDYKVTDLEEKLRAVFCSCGKIADVRLVKNNKGQFRGFGYIGFEAESAAAEALKLDREPLEGRPMYVSPNIDKKKQPNVKVFKYVAALEKHKLFVSNISFHTTEETLEREFSQHGPLRGVRIVTNRRGQSKGLAYVEYVNESDAAQAVIKMDGKELDNFALQVAISNPPSRKPTEQVTTRGGGETFRGGRGRGRTQLSMVPRSLQRSERASDVTVSERARPSTSSGMTNKDFANMLLKK